VYNISSATNPTYNGDRCADGIYVDGGKDIVIERNTVDNCDIGVEIASEHGGRTTSNITVRSNFVSRSYQGNVMSGGYGDSRGNASNIVIVNNTLYHGRDGEVVLQFNCSGVTIKNNICVANSGTDYISASGSNNSSVTVDNNLYYGASTSDPGTWNDAHAKFANPMLVNAPADMHVAASSPAKNSGVALDAAIAGTLDIDGQARVQENAIDIGADEIGTAAILPDYIHRFQTKGRIAIFENRNTTLIRGLVPGEQAAISIFSMSGKCMRSEAFTSDGTDFMISRGNLAPGRYVIQTITSNDLFSGNTTVK
jgi:hypothetical protein